MPFLILSALSFVAVFAMFFYYFRVADSAVVEDGQSDLKIYLDQLEEVDRDLERGVVSQDQADKVRAEIGRRILAAKAESDQRPRAQRGPTGALLLTVLGVLAAGSVGLYLSMGSYGYTDLPRTERIADLEKLRAARPSQIEAEEVSLTQKPAPQDATQEHLALVAQLRDVVAARPEDIQGLRLLAQQEAMLGNYAAARSALETVVSIQGDAAQIDDLVRLFDTMVFNANDYISPEAEAVLIQINESAPELLISEFYLGMVEIQNGRPDLAFPIWRDLVETSPANAPWVDFVRSEMAGVAAAAGVSYDLPPMNSVTAGPTAADIVAADGMAPTDRQEMIVGMVDQLSERLGNEGGSVEEWGQLIRALTVLGRNNQAKAIFDEAHTVFEDDTAALNTLSQLGSEIGFE